MSTQGKPIATVMVLGAGVMGRGIAALFAGAGLKTVVVDPLVDPNAEMPEGATLLASLPDEAPDLIVEAVFEDFDLKVREFRKLEEAYGDAVIIASNTSGLPLEDMAATLQHPERFLGMHFWTPANISPLVEVVRVEKTTDSVIQRVEDVLNRAGREALMVSRPVVGYLWNRLQHTLLHEAYHLIETGIASPRDLDKIASNLFGPRFCATGMIQSKDMFNLVPHINAQHTIVPHLDRSTEPCAMLDRMLERGQTGLLAGQGFYDWRGRDATAILQAASQRLTRILAFLEAERAMDTEPEVPLAELPLAD